MEEGQPSIGAAFGFALAEERPRPRGFARIPVRQSDSNDDLVQETLLPAVAAQARFELGANLRAWLFTILRHARAAGRYPAGVRVCTASNPSNSGGAR